MTRMASPGSVSYTHLDVYKRQVHNCPEDWEKVRSMLRSLGRAEVYAALHEQGEVVIKDDICNREYRFDAPAIDQLFGTTLSPAPPTVH